MTIISEDGYLNNEEPKGLLLLNSSWDEGKFIDENDSLVFIGNRGIVKIQFAEIVKLDFAHRRGYNYIRIFTNHGFFNFMPKVQNSGVYSVGQSMDLISFANQKSQTIMNTLKYLIKK